jgi:hypothetical protein
MNQPRKIALAFCAGIVGGVLPSLMPWRAAPAAAQDFGSAPLAAPGLRLTDGAGRTYALVAREGAASHLTFFNQEGKPLLALGVNADGLPAISLMSAKNDPAPRLEFKLVGANQSAALVFRDSKGRTRMFFGLDPNAPDEDPFFVYYDKNMGKKSLFGTH